MPPQSEPRTIECPKRMTYGPCGGVRPNGGCEMASHPCGFLSISHLPPIEPAADPRLDVKAPLVLTDLSVPAADAATLTSTAQTLAASCDALLVGDHQDRPDFPPTVLARLIADAGAHPWVTLACRDRNRVTLESELQGLHHQGLATVLCVTGDGRAHGIRPEVTQVFDLEGTRLAALAASLGLPVAVVETPTAPPVGLRAERLVRKQQAGASVAVLNHVRTPALVATFVRAARAAGLVIPLLASVAVFTDARSASVLAALPGLEIEPATVSAVLAASDPVEAGIRAALAEAEALLAVPGVAGINLSGMASARGVAFAANVQAEIGLRVKAHQREQAAPRDAGKRCTRR